MDNLYIDFEQGLILGNKIKSEANELKELLQKFDECREQINSMLIEEDDKKIINEIATEFKLMNMLADSTFDTGNFLVNVSSAYKNISEENNNE